MGSDEIKTTSNHKFLIREKYRKGHKRHKMFSRTSMERNKRFN